MLEFSRLIVGIVQRRHPKKKNPTLFKPSGSSSDFPLYPLILRFIGRRQPLFPSRCNLITVWQQEVSIKTYE